MRSREDIENEAKDLTAEVNEETLLMIKSNIEGDHLGHQIAEEAVINTAVMLEVLLDIRDLLTKHEPTANPADPQSTEGSQDQVEELKRRNSLLPL